MENQNDNPSLQPEFDACLCDAYEDARYTAADETDLPLMTFPAVCPYPPERLLDGEWLPE